MRPCFSKQNSVTKVSALVRLTDFWWNPSPFLENHPGKGGEILLSRSL